MRILLIGRAGQLGGDLLRHNRERQIAAPDRGDLDIVHPQQVRAAIERHRPDLVVNCAAFHNVPLCEEQPEQAMRVNCVAVGSLAAACRDAGVRLITFSSDYVFGATSARPTTRTIPQIRCSSTANRASPASGPSWKLRPNTPW